MLREEQIDIRRQRAKAGNFQIENLGKNRVFSDYRVTNPESGGQYTVAVRGFELGDNTCTCPDFKSNTLGTCKHVEAVLDHLKDELPAHLQKKKAAGHAAGNLPPLRRATATRHSPACAPLGQARQTRRRVLRREGAVVRARGSTAT